MSLNRASARQCIARYAAFSLFGFQRADTLAIFQSAQISVIASRMDPECEVLCAEE
jgi:hypothetical protein